MKVRSLFLSLLASFLVGFSFPSMAQVTKDIEIGQVIQGDVGQTINGWENMGGGLYPKRIARGEATVETDECCQTLFKKGRTFLLAGSRAEKRNARGGVEAERITHLKKITLLPGEEHTDCTLLWLRPLASFYNPTSKMARSFIFDGESIREVKWVASPDACYMGD